MGSLQHARIIVGVAQVTVGLSIKLFIMSLPFTPLFIDGQEVSTSTQATFEIRNPFSGQVVGISASASSEDCKAAVESSANAFRTWEHTSAPERRDIFLRAADIVSTDVYREKVKKAMQEETAAVDYWCHYNWGGAANFLRVISGFVNELRGTTFPSGIVPGARVETHRRAIGVMFAFFNLYLGAFAHFLQSCHRPLECSINALTARCCVPPYLWEHRHLEVIRVQPKEPGPCG